MSSEASSLAGHLGLGKLIVLYDDNSITIDGETDLSFTEDVVKVGRGGKGGREGGCPYHMVTSCCMP